MLHIVHLSVSEKNKALNYFFAYNTVQAYKLQKSEELKEPQ